MFKCRSLGSRRYKVGCFRIEGLCGGLGVDPGLGIVDCGFPFGKCK